MRISDWSSDVCSSDLQEQLLATGASVMNILNAVHMLGYGAFWSTGMGTYLEEVQEALGFDALDYRFLGFLAIGTPACGVDDVVRQDYREFVTEWAVGIGRAQG